jgi:hypothetical protein
MSETTISVSQESTLDVPKENIKQNKQSHYTYKTYKHQDTNKQSLYVAKKPNPNFDGACNVLLNECSLSEQELTEIDTNLTYLKGYYGKTLRINIDTSHDKINYVNKKNNETEIFLKSKILTNRVFQTKLINEYKKYSSNINVKFYTDSQNKNIFNIKLTRYNK